MSRRKRMLMIVNPCAGQRKMNRRMTEVIGYFCQNGYEPRVFVTGHAGEGHELAKAYASDSDIIVCAGGDGTLNEVVSGELAAAASIPIGYIPCGTTNDLANTLGLSRDVDQAARDIVNGVPRQLDIGCFNGRHFIYTASFGAFTRVSYSTPQTTKNAVGHLAYVLEGIKDIPQISPIRMTIHADDQQYEGEFLFGAISNSTSIAGILTINEEQVALNDGKFELLLVDAPKNAVQLGQIMVAVSRREYEGELVHMTSARHITLHSETPVSWTLDGEYEPGGTELRIENLHNALSIIVPREKNQENKPEGREFDD